MGVGSPVQFLAAPVVVLGGKSVVTNHLLLLMLQCRRLMFVVPGSVDPGRAPPPVLQCPVEQVVVLFGFLVEEAPFYESQLQRYIAADGSAPNHLSLLGKLCCSRSRVGALPASGAEPSPTVRCFRFSLQ